MSRGGLQECLIRQRIDWEKEVQVRERNGEEKAGRKAAGAKANGRK
jgi:hypothetical protein